MVSACSQSGHDEKRCIGHWFEAMSDLVNSHPSRTGTAPSKKFEYDRTTVTRLSRDFNTSVKQGRAYSDAERATAAKHLYRMDKNAKWTDADTQSLEDVANSRYMVETMNVPSATLDMLKQMKQLYETARRHRIGISVHTPEPGLIQIDFVPQERPKLVPKPKPPQFTPGG